MTNMIADTISRPSTRGIPCDSGKNGPIRRICASLIYKATGNLRAIQILLSHSNIENIVGYLASMLTTRSPLQNGLRFSQTGSSMRRGASCYYVQYSELLK